MNMSVIYKYELELRDEQVLKFPPTAPILKVGVQNGTPCIWAELPDKTAQVASFKVKLVGTGGTFDANGYTYLGTFLLHNDTIVLHAYWKRG